MLTYAYDDVGNLSSAALPLASASFSYNKRNQLASISRLNGVSTSFSYDTDTRLLSLTHAKGASVIDAENYGYDFVGNRVSHNTSIGQSLVTQPVANQFDNADELTVLGGAPNSYDANGNLVHDAAATYLWDGRNRLKSIVTGAGQTTTFTYDFAGNLIQQADTGTSINLTKAFVLDSLTNVAFETADDGSSYDVLSGRSTDSHLAIIQSSGQPQYGLTDAINSTVVTVDQSGGVKSQFLYDAYGKTTATGTYPFQFTGRMPVSSGLYYYRARFYSPTTGRFIGEDPMVLLGGENSYRYVRNDPADRIDPLGLADNKLPPDCQAGSSCYEAVKVLNLTERFSEGFIKAVPIGLLAESYGEGLLINYLRATVSVEQLIQNGSAAPLDLIILGSGLTLGAIPDAGLLLSLLNLSTRTIFSLWDPSNPSSPNACKFLTTKQ
jgi:RHS repeat-associated protein